MTKCFIAAFTTVFLLLFVIGAASALEVGGNFNIGNLVFDPMREESETDFEGTYFPFGISAYLNQDLSKDLSLHAGYYMDPILKNTIYTEFIYHHEFLTLGVGPYFGVFNSTTTLLKPGISTNVRLEFPGVVFIDFRAESSIGGRIIQEGDYIQEQSAVSAGFYVPHAICSVNILTKKYTEKKSSKDVIDNLTEYSFSADVFQKNSPYKVLLTFGYQDLSKLYITDSDTTTHTLGTLFIDTKVDFYITQYLTLLVQLRGSVFTFGQNELLGISNPGPGSFLFDATAGVVLDIDAIIERTKPKR
jgi:hypothetical protein